MRLLVLGAGGMLGHKLVQLLSGKYEVVGTVRKSAKYYRKFSPHLGGRLVGRVDVNNFSTVKRLFQRIQPQLAINCVGIVKQQEAVNDPLIAISVNSLFPHRLAGLCRSTDTRLIHISSDCVFSGDRGMYEESDVPDANDLYGRTKLLGELDAPHCLTLRTSLIGRELESSHGLLEWFLVAGQREVRGFRRAVFSGLTTLALARVIESIIEAREEIIGLYHVSSDPINKHELLLLAQEAFGIPGKIIPSDTPVIDRSLNSAKFRRIMNYSPPSWRCMILALAADPTPYSRWHGKE